MRPKTNLITILVFSAITLLGQSTALADDFKWIARDNGQWTDAANWIKTSGKSTRTFPNHVTDSATIIGPGLCEVVPTPIAGACISGCNLTITSGNTLTVTTCLVITCKLTIEPNAYLLISANAYVELSGDNINHEIGGRIKLLGSNSTLRISGNATLDPFVSEGKNPTTTYGHVQGLNNDASIDICTGKTLTNNITICGMMKIQSVSCGAAAAAESASAADSAKPEKNSAEKTADKAKPQNLRTKKTVPVAQNTTTSSVIFNE